MRPIWLAVLLAAAGCAGGVDGEDLAVRPEAAVLLHGLGRTDRSMRPLEKRLTDAGFEVHNLRYASTDEPFEALVEELGREVETCCAEAPAVHFVGHSLGGLVARAYLAQEPPANAGRVVMLAAPNRGSELVDAWGDSALFRSVLGPAAQELGTDPESLPNRLPPPVVEIGVIAGTGSVFPIGSAVIPDEDDGMVSLASTRLEGMKDFLVVPSSHAFIMRSEEVGRQVIHFLRHGRFQQILLVAFLVRHGEKVGASEDPELSEAGRRRAVMLARTLRSAELDYVHSSDYIRTRETAAPAARANGLDVELYDPRDLPALVEKLRSAGGRHLVVGHSNTTPELAELLGGASGPPIDEDGEYDRLYVVTVGLDGAASSVLMRYGRPYSPAPE